MLRASCGCAVAAVALATGASSAAVASSAPPRVRLGELPNISAHAASVGGVAGSTPMHVTITLRPRDPAALTAYAREVATPGSSVYRDYLTAHEFANRFGPTKGQVAAVEASLRAHGLTPGPVSANRLAIPVAATAARIGRAFSVAFRRMRLADGRDAVAASAPPAIDAGIAGDVQGVLGLTSVPARPLLARPAALRPAARSHLVARATARVATGGPQPCAAASAAASQQGAYTADQIASAYRFSGLYGAGDEGQGQTIAIYELEPNDPNDIAAYQACYGTTTPVSYIPVDGGAGSGAGSGEAALDIEQVIGLAPKATLLVYQGPNANQNTPGSGPYDLFNTIISQDRAQVISVSWGECEQLDGSSAAGSESNLFEEAAVQGQSIVAATGDEGSEDCNGAFNGLPDTDLAVDDPGSQPFVTGVGGTTLSSLGPPPTETVWNNGGNPASLLSLGGGAGGGGVSRLWKMPGYQSGAASSLHLVQANSTGSTCDASSGYCREVPDVSADADPNTGYIFYFNGSGTEVGAPSGWQAVGGTSGAAPVWAALLADVNASSACRGSPVGFANPALYLAAAASYSQDFNDITSGNNDLTGTNGGLYPAGPAYDMASGLGTPNAAALAPGLCADALRVSSPGSQRTTVGQSVGLTIHTTAPAGSRITYSASHLPAGLAISASSGHISGKPRSAGVSTVEVAALDQNFALRGVSFTWTVQGRPTVSHEALTGVGAGHPRLALTVSSGRDAPGVKSVSIGLPSGLAFASPRRHVAVTGPGGRPLPATVRVTRGHLVITLRGTALQVHLTVSDAAITAAAALAGKVRALHAPRLPVSVAVTDASHRTTTQVVRIRPRG